jgi:pimeloyl-ACP methyl ester carboxylesterase
LSRFVSEYDNSKVVLDDGNSLSYHAEGKQKQSAVLLLHGLNAHSGTWRKNVFFLANDSLVLAPTLQAWRGSSKDLDVVPYVRMVEQFLKKVDHHRVSIIGNSMGGWIALGILQDRPDMIEAIVLEDSAGLSKTNFAKINEARKQILIIWGRNDKTIPLGTGFKFHDELTESDLIILENAGHVPHWEKSGEFNGLVSDFLRRTKEKRSR